MRHFQVMAALAGLAICGPALAAETFDDPKALVTAIYAGYQPGAMAKAPTAFYSHKLQAVFDQAVENKVFTNDAAVKGGTFAPAQIFNPFMPDASALLFDVSVSEPMISGDHAVVNVSYHNFDQPRLLTIAAVREDGGWKVDDVAALGRDDHWLLSWALTFDPTGF
ncbi:MAG: hypothetical protein ACOH2L_12145 [Devosia sp.]